MQGAPQTSGKEQSVYLTCWENWLTTWKKIELDPSDTTDRGRLRMDQRPNQEGETIKSLEEGGVDFAASGW